MTRIEQLQVELAAEVEKLSKPLTELFAAANELQGLILDTRRVAEHISDNPLARGRLIRALLYFRNEAVLAQWNAATRGLSAVSGLRRL